MRIKLPLVIVNLKAHPESIEKPLHFAEIARKVSDETNVNVAIAPPITSLKSLSEIVPTFAQAIDPRELGAHTGSITAEEIKKSGAIGAIINHAERRLDPKDIAVCVKRCRENELLSIVCVKDDLEAEAYATLEPDFIAIEPPELIGKLSVTQDDPEIVERSVKAVERVSDKVKVICGAGIKSKEDVEKALELGAAGVLVSSHVVKSADVEKALKEISDGCV